MTSTDSVLISLTVDNIEEVHESLKGSRGVEGLSEIKQVKDLALKSFFFTGPEGYHFEVEQFTSGALSELSDECGRYIICINRNHYVEKREEDVYRSSTFRTAGDRLKGDPGIREHLNFLSNTAL